MAQGIDIAQIEPGVVVTGPVFPEPVRGLIMRNLIVTPANLTSQWQREMKDKFREQFEVVRSDVLRADGA